MDDYLTNYITREAALEYGDFDYDEEMNKYYGVAPSAVIFHGIEEFDLPTDVNSSILIIL